MSGATTLTAEVLISEPEVMGDDSRSASAEEDPAQPLAEHTSDSGALANAAFQSQLESLPCAARSHGSSDGSQQLFDMSAMSQGLSHVPIMPIGLQRQCGPFQMPEMIPSHDMLSLSHRGYPIDRIDPDALAISQRMQQTPFMNQQYGHQQMSGQAMQQMQIQGQYAMATHYGYEAIPPLQAMVRRYAQIGPPDTRTVSGDYSRRAGPPGAAPVPVFPRGPPRKPKQSGHALWVGNLPPNACIEDLKEHFSRDATADIESVFLISKSNCAFVNYHSAKACADAMVRFHDSRFYGVRLVCRLRRRSVADAASETMEKVAKERGKEMTTSSAGDSPVKKEEHKVSSDPDSSPAVRESYKPLLTTATSAGVSEPPTPTQRVSEKYFIVKSLTVQDLESSVRTGIWATQIHNETILSHAYQNTDNVYLIFSANKSGEYFGYARMASSISSQTVSVDANASRTETAVTGIPRAIETSATSTAPRGRIVDDSARGTIFWEAISTGGDGNDTEQEHAACRANWACQFSIRWISTARVPFYRTRGLRNSWNSNREVKIARDGTEIEPSTGRKLLRMFHQTPSEINPHQGSMHHR